MFLLRKHSVTALASAFLIASAFYFYDHRRSVIPEYIPSPEKAEEITLLGAKTDASRFAPASEIKKRVSGQTKTQINPEDVAANSDSLIEALRSAKEQVASTARSTKQNQLGSFLQSMGATREVRQSLTEAGELRGIYGDIPFMVEMGLEKGEKEALVRNLVRDNSEFFGLESEDQIASVSVDCVGGDCTAHIEKQYAGLQAPGHQLALSFGADSIHAIIGKFEPPKISLQRIPDRLSPEAVVAELASHLGRSSDQIAAGEAVVEQTIESLGVIDFFAERWEGVWIGAQPYEVIINSATVKVVAVIPLVKRVQVDASGEDLFGNRRSFKAEKISETSYLMKDEGFPENYETLVMDFEGLDFEEIKKRVNNGQMQLEDIKLVTSASPSSGWDPAAVSLLTSTREAIAYYWESHEYRAVNEDGANLGLAINSFGGNAGMWGSYLAEYGVGTGRIAGEGVSFARAKDVVGHEITHGVIDATSGLVYADQSGALNESYADFFGSVIEHKGNWLLGEDLLHPSGSTLRNMANPSDALNGGQPSHISQYVISGGVHTNSGIHNRALYLIAEGLTQEGLGTSIGITKTADLVFKTMKGLTRNANFDDAANLLFQKAVSKYGDNSTEAEAVLKGLQAVGLLSVETTSEEVESEISFAVSDANAIAYLRPYYGVDEVTDPYLDYYYLYLQVFENSSLVFAEELSFGYFNGSEEFKWGDYSRPTLVNYQDGTYRLIFKDKDGDVYITGSEYSEPAALQYEYQLEDVSYSPDGRYLTWVVAGSPYVYVYDYDSEEVSYAYAAFPSTAQGGDPVPVDFIDTVRFGPTSRKVAFDFLRCDLTGEISCGDEGAINYWSVGVLDVATMEVDFPLKDQPSRYDIGFPSFSNLTDRYIAVDLVDYQADNESGVSSAVYIYDLETRGWTGIVSTDGKSTKTGHYGTPSFSSDDSSVVFSYDTDNGPLIYAASLEEYALADSESAFSLLNPFEASLPYTVPLISVEKKPSLRLVQSRLEFGDVVKGQTSQPQLVCAENLGEFNISIGVNEAFSEVAISGLFSSLIQPKQKKCWGMSLNSAAIPIGPYEKTLSLDHDGLNAAIPVTISGYVDLDTDSDGLLNYLDTDDDNDEVLDADDAFPLDASESLDTDSDGIGNNADEDDDGDGFSDTEDAFPLDESESLDTDSDGVGNNADPDDDNDEILDADDAFPLDASESLDTDLDGVGNNADTDDDNDGVPDLQDAFALDATEFEDTDADGIGNNSDTDDDNDGTLDADDAFPLDETESVDTDSDGVGNNADTDDDADGVLDEDDAFPLDETESVDSDSDGVGNNTDTDDDNDEVLDADDAFPLDASESLDTDSDGIGDNADTDDDGDEVADELDAFPLDRAEAVDTDSDGVGNNADLDDDNDGLSDEEEIALGTNTLLGDTDSDGVSDLTDDLPLDPLETVDTDADGIGNNSDSDDDGDSLSDDDEGVIGTNPLVSDTDQDGVDDGDDLFPLDSAEWSDSDLDGVGDNADAFPFDATEIADVDGDGFGDNIDLFDDDPFESLDTDLDGIGNNADLDDDNDGFTDEEELADGTNPLSRFSCRQGCFSFDVDENREAKALTDGLLVIRHLFGFTGDALASGAVATDADRNTPESISSLLSEADSELDIDGNGESKALTDGLLLIRYLFGFTGDALTAGAIGGGATRSTSEDIEAYIGDRIPSE